MFSYERICSLLFRKIFSTPVFYVVLVDIQCYAQCCCDVGMRDSASYFVTYHGSIQYSILLWNTSVILFTVLSILYHLLDFSSCVIHLTNACYSKYLCQAAVITTISQISSRCSFCYLELLSLFIQNNLNLLNIRMAVLPFTNNVVVYPVVWKNRMHL